MIFNMIIGGNNNANTSSITEIYATINVSYPNGSICTCTDGEVVLKAATTNGEWIFPIPYAGEWIVSCTNGGQTDSKTINVTSVGQSASATLEYFFATINITYPAGSNCEVKNSNGTTVASDINVENSAKTWNIQVVATGAYTITATDASDNSKTINQTISITANGQNETIVLEYPVDFSADITITYPANSTCVVKNSSGVTVANDVNSTSLTRTFGTTVTATGTYTITATANDGTGRTKSATVNIASNGQSASTTLKYFSATINVAYPSGSTLTCVNGATKFTATTTTGSHSFIVPNTGTWTVSCSNGSQTDSETVNITSDGQSASVTLEYFSATINVTYPAKSNCVVKSSSGATVINDSNTSEAVKVLSVKVITADTYTVTATTIDESDTISENVSITSSGQSKSVILTYHTYIFKSGTGDFSNVSVTPPNDVANDVELTTDYILVDNISNAENGYGGCCIQYSRIIDLTNISMVYADVLVEGVPSNSSLGLGIAVYTYLSSGVLHYYDPPNKAPSYIYFPADNTRRIVSLDVSGVTGEMVIAIHGSALAKIYNFYFK